MQPPGSSATPAPGADTAPAAARPTASPLADPWIGRELGKYVILRPLGAGGMGVVYEAEDVSLKRRVAVKLLPLSVAADPVALQRFLREAQAAARLNHPNVVAIHEIDQRDGTYYIVMELVPGGNAQARLNAGGPVAWQDATRMIADACRGLAAAHAAGLIHRDLKPANLMFAADGSVKLADFGLAKATDHAGGSVTALGQVMGTPHYMSPEQCRGESLDPRSDVYALGATYYALLTGAPPYDAGTAMGILFAHCGNPIPDPRAGNPAVPEACAAVVQRALAKEPAGRFAGAAEMLAALEALRPAPPEGRTMPVSIVPPTPPRRRQLGVAAAVALVLVLGGVALWMLLPGTPRQKRVLLVVPHKHFWYPDYAPVRRLLERAGVKVDVGSSAPGLATPAPWSKEKESVQVDRLLDNVTPSDYDAVVFCGVTHDGFDQYAGDKAAARQAQGLARKMLDADKPVAALCNGVLVLAAAGLLQGKQATCFEQVEALVRKSGAILQEKRPVVVAEGPGKALIITGGHWLKAEPFVEAILQALGQPSP
jgi:serine/threonine protein kinase/putative intracellular protease/amidase